MSKLIFVDCEATGLCPGVDGVLTEFGAVDYKTRKTFHGKIWRSHPDLDNPAKSTIVGEEPIYEPSLVFKHFAKWLKNLGKDRPIFISDNPAYDFMWINHGFVSAIGRNPFGHSGRRISDFYAGLTGNFSNTQEWKKLRETPHDHHPVNDAMGNVEAFEKIMEMQKARR